MKLMERDIFRYNLYKKAECPLYWTFSLFFFMKVPIVFRRVYPSNRQQLAP